ncbi:flavonoid 3-O-glucosyltransferase [Hevea brasiliensis]|uniref:flavonoid 3-O-glucosyltransferase n=1 Tax=Hevea brasiliensis TaxID=3981 RepID=UPI0025ED1F24|nr:flavonoid 3-O-glucosyltransferase [Hevea brasiliensis]
MPGDENVKKLIAVLAFPFATHASPLLSLVQRLSPAVPEARFIFFNTAKSNNAIFLEDDKRWDSIRPYNVSDGTPENYVSSGSPMEPIENFAKATPENFRTAMETVVEETGMGFSCIITDAFYWFAADMAQELQAPWVAFWTAGPRSVLLHLDTDLIRGILKLSSGIDGKMLDFLPGFSGICATDIPPEITCGDLNSPMPRMLHKMGLMLPKATAVAINSFEEIDTAMVNLTNSRFKKFLNIGPLVLTLPDLKISDSEGCLQWLDKQKQESVAYISFGSTVMPPPHELEALAEALETSGFHFIWSIRGNPEEKLPKGFLERTKDKGIVVSWAPQLKILQHEATGAFITHCGWNSVLESIVGGVPMICRAFFGDQRLNMRTIENVWGVGTGIGDGEITKDGAMKALELVLSSEEGQYMRQKLEDIRKLAFDAVQSHGSSTANFETLTAVITK